MTPRTTWTREDGKTFPIFISEAAFEEWLGQRQHLINRGVYPDRPPDVDTETTRQWVSHPGEESYAAETLARQAGIRAEKPLHTETINFRGIVLKLLIDEQPNDRLRYRIDVMDERNGSQIEVDRAESSDGKSRAEVEEQGHDRFDEMVRLTCVRFDVPEPKRMVTTREDYEAAMADSDALVEAIEKFYGQKVPTAGGSR